MYRNKTRQKSNIAFIVELFIMFLLLLTVIVVITMVCMTTRSQSLRASDLTDAVICAENTAEITSTAGSADEVAKLIGQMEGTDNVTVKGDTITADQNDFNLKVVVTPDKGDSGVYIDKTISIYQGGKKPLYELHAGNYSKSDNRSEKP